MRLYLAGVGNTYKYLEGLPDLAFLVSYYYLKSGSSHWSLINYALSNNIPIMLDSGAWTAMTKGIEIDNKEYISFCKQHRDIFNLIISLDVIGNWQKTKLNHDEMVQSGINSTPTFHFGSPFEALTELTQTSNYIGLGGIATKGNHVNSRRWLKYIFHLYPGVNFHGFGVTTPELLKSWGWYSVDGTTWMTAAARFGRIMVNTGNGSFTWVALNNKKQLNQHWHAIADDLKDGWDINKGRLPDYEKVALRYNARSLIELVKYCSTNKHTILQDFLL